MNWKKLILLLSIVLIVVMLSSVVYGQEHGHAHSHTKPATTGEQTSDLPADDSDLARKEKIRNDIIAQGGEVGENALDTKEELDAAEAILNNGNYLIGKWDNDEIRIARKGFDFTSTPTTRVASGKVSGEACSCLSGLISDLVDADVSAATIRSNQRIEVIFSADNEEAIKRILDDSEDVDQFEISSSTSATTASGEAVASAPEAEHVHGVDDAPHDAVISNELQPQTSRLSGTVSEGSKWIVNDDGEWVPVKIFVVTYKDGTTHTVYAADDEQAATLSVELTGKTNGDISKIGVKSTSRRSSTTPAEVDESGTTYTTDSPCPVGSCTIATTVIPKEDQQNEEKIPPNVFIDGEKYEPFWDGQKWDYCTGPGCICDEECLLGGGKRLGSNSKHEEVGREVKITVPKDAPLAEPEPEPELSNNQKETKAILDALKAKRITHQQAYDQLDAIATEAEAAITDNDREIAELEKEYDRLVDQISSGEKLTEEDEKILARLDEIADEQKKLGDDGKSLERIKAAEEARDVADSQFWKFNWAETLGRTEGYNYIREIFSSVSGIGTFARDLGRYQPLSNLLFKDLTQDFIEFSNVPAINFLSDIPSFVTTEMCRAAFVGNSKTPGQDSAFYLTRAGTRVFAGGINAEVTKNKVPILCRRNPDEEADEEFICNSNQVCRENGFCYKDETTEQPLEGFFYKIAFSVTAPQDQKYTPDVDENGRAVRFNIRIGNKWVYSIDGIRDASVIQLNNADSYSNIILKYSTAPKYNQVCVVFDDRYRIEDKFARDVPDLCATFIESNQGEVEFKASDKSGSSAAGRAPSVTPETGEVIENEDW